MQNKTSKNILLVIMGILILVELVSSIATADSQNAISSICKVLSLAFVALYGFWLYKKPHGNMLKYAMLFFAATEIIRIVQNIQLGYGDIYMNVLQIYVIAIVVYVAGRLNRIEQNKYLLAIAAVAQFAGVGLSAFSSVNSVTALRFFTRFSSGILIITLMIAYFTRYKEHKEAGLADAPKAK